MSPAQRRITAKDIMDMSRFGEERMHRRRSLLPRKKLRRIDVGPDCTFYFETYDTMWFQIHEMLLIEKGGEAQVPDELAAYNPMIPQGSELTATIMFEIDNPIRRANLLGKLGGVEEHFFLQIGSEKIFGQPEGDIERTDESGKASSVHFIHFPLSSAQKESFENSTVTVMAGVDHPEYGHAAILSAPSRAELATDFE